jgi:hypothetical protein
MKPVTVPDAFARIPDRDDANGVDPADNLTVAAEVLGWSAALYEAIEAATLRGDTEHAREMSGLGRYLSDMWWSNTREAAMGAGRVSAAARCGMKATNGAMARETDPAFDLTCASEVLGWSAALYQAIEAATMRGNVALARALSGLGRYLSDMWRSNTREAAMGADRGPSAAAQKAG